MSSISLFEQLTSNVSLSMLAIVSAAILALLLIYTVAGRLFYSSSKSKIISSNKDKKSNTTSTNKKKDTKAKKNVTAGSSSAEEKATLVAPTKKSTSPSKKVTAGNDINKIGTVMNGMKISVREENVEGQNGDNKKKQSKTNTAPASAYGTITTNKQSTSGNAITSNKKQPVAMHSEVKLPLTVDGETVIDQENDGQWLTQGSKQVNNRNRNKTETSPSALSNRNVTSDKQLIPIITINNTSSSSTNKNEFDVESNIPIQNQEPIEIHQLLPTTENRYTANDNWWKQALNKQQTFSIDDIGEWPEREQDEQYTVQIKRIIPIRKTNEQQNNNNEFYHQTESTTTF